MVHDILVAVDGSPQSRHAARFAYSLARQVKANVTLLTVLPPPDVMPLGPLSAYAVMSPGLTDAEVKSMHERLGEIAAEYPDVKTTKQVEIGAIAETIVDTASHQGVDLIVVGARGLGVSKRFLLGSVSDRVVHHAHCPVMVWR